MFDVGGCCNYGGTRKGGVALLFVSLIFYVSTNRNCQMPSNLVS